MVWTRLVADLETPVSAMLKVAHERPNSFLLESVEGGATRGRYSIIGCEPDLIWRAEGNKAELNRAPQSDPDAFAPSSATGARVAPRAAGGIGHHLAATSYRPWQRASLAIWATTRCA